MGKKSQPTPDIVGAAKTEGVENRITARDTTYADRPDQYNPFGSLNWGQEVGIDPATGEQVTKWTQTQGMTPEMQAIFDQQMAGAGAQTDMYTDAIARAQGEMAAPLDWDQFGEAQDFGGPTTGDDRVRGPTTGDERFAWDSANRTRAEDAAYDSATSRLDPRFSQAEQAQEISLRNKGLRPGDEAYDAAVGNFGRDKNDAYAQALRASVGEGRMEDQQSFSQAQGAFNTNKAAEQQQFGQYLSKFEADKFAEQQQYDQDLGSTEFSNSLRDKKIAEYLSKRKFSLEEAQALDPTGNLQGIQQTYSGGGSA